MRLRILLCLMLLAASLHAGEVTIRKINIRSLNVFESTEFDAWYYRWANHLHLKTRASFIRRELLVKEGDVLDEDLLRESERNLRGYGFLTSAEIEVVPVNESQVDLNVTTEDQWTLEFNLSYGKSRGSATYDAGFQENNFLGRGRKIGLWVEGTEERDRVRGYYGDPRFLNSRWSLNLGASNATDGYDYNADLALPFYSEDSRWSFEVSWRNLKEDERFYLEGDEAARQQLRSRQSLVALQHAWGPRYRKVIAGVAFGTIEKIYPEAPFILEPDLASQEPVFRNLNPPDRQYSQAGPTFTLDYQRFTTRTYMDAYGPIEYLPYGPLFKISLLKTFIEQGDDYMQWTAGGRIAFAPGTSHYAVLSGEFGIRRQSGEWNNLLAAVNGRAYLQHGPSSLLFFRSPRQTLAAAVSTVFSRDVDVPFQLSLGEDEGLRGYGFKHFVGTNSALLNIEERIFTPIENGLLGLAVVPFVDAGTAWGGGTPWQTGFSGGIGIRIGIKKLRGNHVLRFDFAWPFSNTTEHGVSVSFSSGQIFKAL